MPKILAFISFFLRSLHLPVSTAKFSIADVSHEKREEADDNDDSGGDDARDGGDISNRRELLRPRCSYQLSWSCFSRC